MFDEPPAQVKFVFDPKQFCRHPPNPPSSQTSAPSNFPSPHYIFTQAVPLHVKGLKHRVHNWLPEAQFVTS